MYHLNYMTLASLHVWMYVSFSGVCIHNQLLAIAL